MEKEKGFTLIELLGVIVVLGIIAVIATPPIINQIKKSNNGVSEANIRLLYGIGETYIKEDIDKYNFSTGSNICISIQSLISSGDVSEKEIVGDGVKASQNLIYTVDSRGKLNYELKLYSSCTK